MPGLVFASACSNPNGNEADQFYNQAYHTWQFCNGSNWVAEGAAGGSGGPMLISTQTASSSASLQFTNLPTSYNTLFLNCPGLVGSANPTNILVNLGEGAGPTWKTGGHYTVNLIGNWVGSSVYGWSNTAATDLTSGGNNVNTYPTTVRMYIDNVGSSTVYKIAHIFYSEDDNSNGIGYWFTTSYWNSDTNPVTGIEVVASGGTISSGTCSLYGMN